MRNSLAAGRLAALLTIGIWGTTFISTKLLLADIRPVEILLLRFAIGFCALLAACPRRLRTADWRQELTLAAAGLCGVCLYYLLENVALTLTTASNVGVILSSAPLFTAILSRLLMGAEEKIRPRFLLGFAAAMAGILMLSLGGSRLALKPAGDLLAVLAALVWGCYAILSRKISGFGYPVILTTRRTFFYGLLFMIPLLFTLDGGLEPARFVKEFHWLHLLYLGLGASALCFVTWNAAVRRLGAVKTSVYIYLAPVITVAASAVVLGEKATALQAAGIALTLGGLLLSEGKGLPKLKREGVEHGSAK